MTVTGTIHTQTDIYGHTRLFSGDVYTENKKVDCAHLDKATYTLFLLENEWKDDVTCTEKQ